MPAAAGIAKLAAMLAVKLFEERDEKKKRRRGKETQAAGREVTEAVTTPPTAPPSPAPPPFGPPGLTGQVYEPTPLTRTLGRQGVDVAPWEVPEWLAGPGRAAQLEQMGLPVGKEFVGMQGEVRKPIGAQEFLQGAIPEEDRTVDVRPEAQLPTRFGGQVSAPWGQFYPESQPQRDKAAQDAQEATGKRTETTRKATQQNTLRAAINAVAGQPPGTPVHPELRRLIISLGGSEEWARVEAAEKYKLDAAKDARQEADAPQIRAIMDHIQQVGPDNAASLVRMAEAFSPEAGKEANEVVLRLRATATNEREAAKRKAQADLNTIIATGLQGPVSESMARNALQLSLAAGEDRQKALNGYLWLKEPDPEKREMLFARYAGNEVDFRKEIANKQFVADMKRDIDSGELRTILDLNDRLTKMAESTGSIPSEEMVEFIREELTELINEREARNREAEADRGGQDGVTGGSGGEPTIKPPTSTARTIQGRKARAVGSGGSGGSSSSTQDFKYGAVVEFTPPDRPGVTMVGKVSSTPAKGSTERTVTVTRGTHFTDEKGKRKVTGETMSWPMDVLELRRSSRPLVIKPLYKSDEDEKQSGNVGDVLLDELGF
jgi:hypothetical protein